MPLAGLTCGKSSEVFDQQFRENPDLSRRMASRWPDDKYAALRERKACHDGDQGARIQVVLAVMRPCSSSTLSAECRNWPTGLRSD